MPYTFNNPEDEQAMLDAIGAASIEELFAPIPDALRFKRALDIPAAMGELELTQHMQGLAAKNEPLKPTRECTLDSRDLSHIS
ncbi:MAG TPA: hypothetical protein P5307_09335 [Pirellulaceae bacterium]|nr:hypothetical protein [Pirellulaceae bacterium]